MNWTLLSLFFLFCIIVDVDAIDYCRQYELENGGVGYCLNGGSCVNNGYGKQCKCLSGFKGETCTEEINECNLNAGLCLNGATCYNSWGSYSCVCTHGFEGQHCEINRDDCIDNRCPYHKVCVDGFDEYTCECPPGKYGVDCEMEDRCVLDSPCIHGNCSMHPSGNYECDCLSGFMGLNCDTDINECDEEPGEWCINGRCENTFGSYKCECDTGYMGKTCRDLIPHCDGDPCKNGGTCINNMTNHICLCMPGFNGTNCEIREDTSCNKECQNGGVCYQRTYCMCPLPYRGELCEISRPNPCAHNYCGEHGRCSPTNDYNSYYCNCLPGHRGEHCEIRECPDKGECVMSVDYCKTSKVNCSDHGTCLNMADKHVCFCVEGFEGDNCQNTVLAVDSNTVLRSDVIVFLIGSTDNVIGHLRDIVYQMRRLTDVTVRIALTKDEYPRVYEWDRSSGKGDLVDTTSVITPEDTDIYFGKTVNTVPPKRSGTDTSKHHEGFIVAFRVDISICLKAKMSNSSLICPEAAEDIAAQLMKPLKEVLEPLGISLYKMETDDDGRKHSYGIYCAVAGLVIFGTVVLVGVLTITKKKLRYRDRNLIAASTWTPPKTDSKSLAGSINSLNMNCYKGYYDIYNQNASTLTSLGNSSVNGSLTPASCEQRQDHDVSSFPPIHRCIKFANDQQVVGEVKELLSNGADPNSTESMGRTPLMLAVSRRGEIAICLIDLLIQHQADLRRVDRDGLNVLHVAIESTDSFNERAALHLIQNYKDLLNLNAAARSEETPLKMCARIGDLTERVVCALLRSESVDIESIGEQEYPDSKRRTALHVATEVGSVRIMEQLLRSGAKVDAKDINEQTPLHLAAENMRTDATRILLNYAADRTLVDADNQTPEQIARTAFWIEGPKVLNEPPSQQVEKKAADTSSKATKRGKRANNANTKSAKKSKTKPNTNGVTEALLPTPSTLLSPSSDSCSPPTNGLNLMTATTSANSMQQQYTYQNYPSHDYQYPQQQVHLSHPYYHQQQTPEIMNNSVCSSNDSQTLSPPMMLSSASNGHFNYNNIVYPPQPYGYYQNGTRPLDSNHLYPPHRYYGSSSSKVPSYSNGSMIEYSPNSDQSMHNFESPPNATSRASQNIYYQQNPHPTIV